MNENLATSLKLSRRELLALGIGAVAGIAAAPSVGQLAMEQIARRNPDLYKEIKGYKGKFIAPIEDTGVYVVTSIPVRRDAVFTARQMTYMSINGDALGEYSTLNEEGSVTFFRSPEFNSSKSESIKLEDIRAESMSSVFGQDYMAGASNPELGPVFHPYTARVLDGNMYIDGGLWSVLLNDRGKYVDPQGDLIKDGESPYYTPGFFTDYDQPPIIGF